MTWQNEKTEHIEMKITQLIFGILVALMKKQIYQNDMKSTLVWRLIIEKDNVTLTLEIRKI